MKISVHGTQLLWSLNGGNLACMATMESLGYAKCSVSPSQSVFSTLTEIEGANIIKLPMPHWWGTLVDGPRLLWQLPWLFLEQTGHVTTLTKSLSYKGNLASLGNTPGCARVASLSMHMIYCGRQWGLPQVLASKKVKVKVAQWCLTLCEPMECTVHGILQARILEWVAFPFSRGSSQHRNQTRVSCIVGRFFTNWASCRWTSKSFYISWFNEDLFIIIHPLAFHCPSHRVKPLRIAQQLVSAKD